MQNQLKTRRGLRSLSQDQLAIKSGVPQSRIAEAESGARPLSVLSAQKLAPALGSDWLGLYLDNNVAAIKARTESGQERPVKAANVARAIIEIIESGQLSADQRKAAREAVEELVTLVEEAAERSGAGTLAGVVRQSGAATPSGETDRGTLMEDLDRNPRGLRRKKRPDADHYADLDYVHKSAGDDPGQRFGYRQ